MMRKLGFPGMKSLDQFRSLAGSASGPGKTFSLSSRPLQDSISSGSFANLKLTAEKLVKEQATVKTDLELANSKLKKSMEHIRLLEEKLQNAFNENAKLKVKQKEEEKLWKGLESKFSSTRTLCDQLTKTLQHLASQVQNAEKDKGHFEGKLSASSEAIDHLNQQMHDLSSKVVAAEENIRERYKELEKLKIEKEETDKIHKDEQSRTANLMEEKDAMIRKFEEIIAENKLGIGSLNSEIAKLQLELRSKEEEIKSHVFIQGKLEKEKRNIQQSADELSNKLLWSHQEMKKLEGLVHLLATNLAELDKQSLNFMEKFDKLNTLYDLCFKQLQKERDLAAGHAIKSYDQLHHKFLSVTSENKALKSTGHDLNDKILELQKAKESVLSELSGERCVAALRIQTLETEAESLVSRKTEAESVVSMLKEEVGTLSENIRISESKMQDLSLELSKLKADSEDKVEKMEADAQAKVEEIESLQKDSENHQQRVNALENEVNQLQSLLQEKEQFIQQNKQMENKLEEHITENKALLIAADAKLAEAKKQYDLMLESKQLELSRHLKELSQRNDQAINDIRQRYEAEKQEIVNVEKEKAEKTIEEMGRKFDKELADSKEEARQQLLRVKDEHATQVHNIQQEHDQLRAKHDEEMRRVQIQAETELRERVTSLRNEHEVQLKAFTCQYEDECRNLQEELDLHKTKEERQRALLQLQWKVMSDKRQEEQEVNSKKEFSVSPIKRRESRSAGRKRSQHSPVRPDDSVDDEQDSPFPRAAETPVSKLLKKAENVNTGSAISIRKHHKKVTRHEYEVETNTGRTITKRRKSTVMFEDPRKRKRTTPKAKTPRTVAKRTPAVPRSANIGDLFSEGSLNPYADDPYAFD